MTKQDQEFRANEANRLLNEPLLVEALAVLEAQAVEAIVAADKTEGGDALRRSLAMRISVIRELQDDLRGIIAIGAQSVRGPAHVA